MNKTKSKIPTVIGIFILIVGVAMGVFLLQQQSVFRLGASPDIAPKDTRITNITDSSFTVSWVTDRDTIGYIKWGETDNLEEIAHEDTSTAAVVHSVTLRNLSAQKAYFFKINSDGKDFDNQSEAWNVRTAAKIAAPTKSSIISGTVVQENGQPAANVIVFVTATNLSPLSAVTTTTGKWVIPLSSARTSNLTSYIIPENLTSLELFVQGGSLGISTVQASALAANPLPPITLGRVHDFRDQQNIEDEENALDADLELPDESTKSSRFNVSDTDTTIEPTAVTLESVEQGETIYTTVPEFFGKGPDGETITITVESDPVTESLEVSDTGTWRWSPPANLEPGEHTVTLSWKDANGILRTLQRSFIVSAEEEGPAFVSTPSATPKTSPTATPKVTPTATPKSTVSPSPTLIATATPRVTYPATDSAVPDSGVSVPTIVLSLLGLFSLLIGATLKRIIKIE